MIVLTIPTKGNKWANTNHVEWKSVRELLDRDPFKQCAFIAIWGFL
jgi:hypothetical protein